MKKFEWQVSIILAMCLAEAGCLLLYWLLYKGSDPTTAIVVMSSVLIIFTIVAYRMIQSFTKPWGKVVFAIKRLADGDYHFRTEPSADKFGVLVPYINELASKLEKSKHSFESQKDQLNTLVENIGSPLVLIDRNGRIIHTNHSFKSMFSINHLFSRDYNDLIPYPQIKELVDETLRSQKTIRQHIVLSFSIERRHFDVYSAPIMHRSKLRGVVVVLHDITELKKLEKMRKDFVANVSHELKTPVTSIKGFAETLLEEDGQLSPLHQQFLQIISTESDRLQTLISDLLELSKIEQEGFRLVWQPVDLKIILDETLLVLGDIANKKNIQFDVSSNGMTMIDGDPYRLKQMMMNVISNAIAYSPPHSSISIVLRETENAVKWLTTDKGIGMAQEEIPRIFERFYRVDKARSRESGGTGLGLAIVKHLAEAHHANIKVQSKKGEGTTFELTFLKNRPN